ncbi:Uncharacterized protein DBV15_10941 [Temnothorax longispinosus]|uniref:Uncharacterized protein n=1 Tax=Temnothorax longispinosus TaxID=300112 RepID=A0A4V3S9W3_9HYME|nr:Uncharacterized protein DBV15_10941 [Temnothorax longispinosus]
MANAYLGSTFKSMKRLTTEESNGTFYSSNPLTRREPSGGTLDYKGATFSSQATTRQIVDVDNRRIRSGRRRGGAEGRREVEEEDLSLSRNTCHHSRTSSAHQSPSFDRELIPAECAAPDCAFPLFESSNRTVLDELIAWVCRALRASNFARHTSPAGLCVTKNNGRG